MAAEIIKRNSLCPVDGFPTTQFYLQTFVCTQNGDYTDGETEPKKEVTFYYLALCYMCGSPLIYSAERNEVKEDFRKAELYYPALPKFPENVPKGVVRYYQEAWLAKQANRPDDFALNIRKALEAACTDKGVSNRDKRGRFKDLAQRIRELKDIPDEVRGMMQDLRKECNFGGHARAKDKRIDPVFCPLIDEFFNIFILVVYVKAIKLQQFQNRLQAATRQASQSEKAE